MQISTRTRDGITVVALAGQLDSHTSLQAQKELDALLAGAGNRIAVDFTALDYISSAGLRVLLGMAKKLRSSGGALRTFGANATVREVFEISGLTAILPLSAGEEEALAAM